MPLFRQFSSLLLHWLLFPVLAGLFMSCGGSGSNGGGGGGGGNQTPVIGLVNPSSVVVGGPAFSLMISGRNFLSTSIVEWNGSPRPTSLNPSEMLTAQITAADIASVGTASIAVLNPLPGGRSKAVSFAISPVPNPVPVLSDLMPRSAPFGTAFSLIVSGSNFIPSSVLEWNGSAIPTTYVSSTQLIAQIGATQVATTGTPQLAVLTPPPGGGTSDPFIYSITGLPLGPKDGARWDILSDPQRQLIYLALPSTANSHPATVSVFAPTSSTIIASRLVGSDPNLLAISDDESVLYVGLFGSSAVQRLTLPDLIPDISYQLSNCPLYGPYHALDIQVAPGASHTTAVALEGNASSPRGLGGIAIYDDDVRRPTIADGWCSTLNIYDSLQWGGSDTTLFASNNESINTSGQFPLYSLGVNNNGVSLNTVYPTLTTFVSRIHYVPSSQLIYVDDGNVVSPTTGTVIGTFNTGLITGTSQAGSYMVPDSTLGLAFFLGQTPNQFLGTTYTIQSYDLVTRTLVGSMTVQNVLGFPWRFIRWGATGVAFNDDLGYLYAVDTSALIPHLVPRQGARRSHIRK